MENVPLQDSPYRDHDSSNNNHTSTSSHPSTSAQATFEAKAAALRARMPYRPPSPSGAPLSRDSGISSFHHSSNFPQVSQLPPLVRDAPTSRAPNQMSREGAVPRAPGERELDFYERLSSRNQRLFKLYGAATLGCVIVLASVMYSGWNIHFSKLFSPKAKEVLIGVYGWSGYGGLLPVLISILLFTLHTLHRILTLSPTLPEIYSSILSALSSGLLTLFTLLSFFAIKNQGQEHAMDSDFDPCLAPGADKWKRLPCGEMRDKMWGVQMLGIGVGIVAAVLYGVLAIVHLVEAKAGGGGLFERRRGYVRLEQNSLNPYEVNGEEEYEDEEPRGRFKP